MQRGTSLQPGRGWAAAVILALLLGSGAPVSAAAGVSKPNVLFIAIDDLNDWVGCLGGHPDVKTPHLDTLAGRGVLFTKAYCAAPACNPSRAALMTGIRPSTSGVYLNPQPWRQSPVLKSAVTIEGTLNDCRDEDEYWQLEVAIPFAGLPTLAGRTPQVGDQWRFHLSPNRAPKQQGRSPRLASL